MKTFATAAAVTAILSSTYSSVGASPTFFTDRATFEAQMGATVTDDFSDTGYSFSNTNAAMSAVKGETDYESTGHSEWNLVSSARYCAGCNGSFELSFTTSSVSTEDLGVFGVGFDVTSSADVGYIAFITFADGMTVNQQLSAAGTFWAVRSAHLITSIHVGLADRGTTTSGSIQIDNLTLGGDPFPDYDNDGIRTLIDNCPYVANGGAQDNQADEDNDGIGDACDSVNDLDLDSDGVNTDADNCPFIANGASEDNQADDDNDGIGNACDDADALDVDADGVANDVDNCAFVANGASEDNQADSDADGVGDACDSSNGLDLDSDGVNNNVDNCAFVANGVDEDNQADTDADGLGDACDTTDGLDIDSDGVNNDVDNCPNVANGADEDDQADSDADGLGDACDTTDGLDIDGDGVDNADDNCPLDANDNQADSDGDQVGDTCDAVDNNDIAGAANSGDGGGCSSSGGSSSTWALVLIGLVLGFRRRRTRC